MHLRKGLPVRFEPGVKTPVYRSHCRAIFIVVVLFVLGAVHSRATAGGTQSSGGLTLSDAPESSTCEYFDRASALQWRTKLGDWIGADGAPNGKRAFAEALIPDIDKVQVIELEVRNLAASWHESPSYNYGMMLRLVDSKAMGDVAFHSREAIEADRRPVLIVVGASGRTSHFSASADTFLDCSTYRSLGHLTTIAVGRSRVALLRFDISALAERPVRATLKLTTTDRQAGAARIGVYQVNPPLDRETPVVSQGVAQQYPMDIGLGRHRDVVLVEDFERRDWESNWSLINPRSNWKTIDAAPSLGFEPLAGRALQITLAKGNHRGGEARYRFFEETGSEPEELFFRYYLRLGGDWHAAGDGGKLPGLAGTYDRGGWGGRRSNGTNGWSMRAQFRPVILEPHPLAGQTPIASYAYHADMGGDYGERWSWSLGRPGTLVRNRWYCLEQYVRMNTPGKRDGVVRSWIDGVLALQKNDIRFRDISSIRIESAWLDFYFGGTEVPERDMHLFIDQVVIARSRIGCIS